MEAAKQNIKALNHQELSELCKGLGVEGYRFDQLYQWIYQKDITSFEAMSNIRKEFKHRLAERFEIHQMEAETVQISEDGTRKFLFRLNDRESIEAVVIPNGERQTLCLSTQVGCAMGCRFCLTGTLGLTRQLRHDEIVEQVMAVQRSLSDETRLSNIVFMGMGEPLHNLENVVEALRFILNEKGLDFSKNKVTVSTCGLVPQMLKFGELMDVRLAISLTATTDEVRDQLIPINKKYPLKVLFDACKKYPMKRRDRITFEYTLLKGINDSLADAERLVNWLHDVPAKVNLIPFNEFPGAPYERCEDSVMLQFQKYLLDRYVQTNIRHSRGRDILGACGQLKAQMEPKRSAQEFRPV